MVAWQEINFPGWVGGRNWKSGSAQASEAGAGAWPELGKNGVVPEKAILQMFEGQ